MRSMNAMNDLKDKDRKRLNRSGFFAQNTTIRTLHALCRNKCALVVIQN